MCAKQHKTIWHVVCTLQKEMAPELPQVLRSGGLRLLCYLHGKSKTGGAEVSARIFHEHSEHFRFQRAQSTIRLLSGAPHPKYRKGLQSYAELNLLAKVRKRNEARWKIQGQNPDNMKALALPLCISEDFLPRRFLNS